MGDGGAATIAMKHRFSRLLILAALAAAACSESDTSDNDNGLPIGDVSLTYHIQLPDPPTDQRRDGTPLYRIIPAVLDDVDGDGKQDIAIALSWVEHEGISRAGQVRVYSGATGEILHTIGGTTPDDAVGSFLYPIPDISGDGKSDFLIVARYRATAYSGTAASMLYTLYEGDLRLDAFSTLIWNTATGDLFLSLLPFILNVRTGQESDVGLIDSPEFIWDPFKKQFKPSFSNDLILSLRIVPQGFQPSRVFDFPDVDGDGLADLLLANPGTPDDDHHGAGSVDIVSAGARQAIHSLAGKAPEEAFGTTIVLLDDLNNNAVPEILIGAPGTKGDSSMGSPNLGSLHAFSGSDGTQLYSILGTTPNGRFGQAVWLYPDVDADDVIDVLAYTPIPVALAPNQVGRLILFSGRTGSTLWSSLLPFELPAASSEFSAALDPFQATLADVTGDAHPDLLFLRESGLFVFSFRPTPL